MDGTKLEKHTTVAKKQRRKSSRSAEQSGGSSKQRDVRCKERRVCNDEDEEWERMKAASLASKA